jgi:hypothetical protein
MEVCFRRSPWIAIFWTLPLAIGSLGVLLGYHALEEIVFEVAVIIVGALGMFHYGVYSRVCATAKGLDSKDWFRQANWFLPYDQISRIHAAVKHGGKATNTILLIHTTSSNVPYEINMSNYRNSDMNRLVNLLRERATRSEFADDLSNYIRTI